MTTRHIKIAAVITSLFLVGCLAHWIHLLFTVYEKYSEQPNMAGFFHGFLRAYRGGMSSSVLTLDVVMAGVILSGLVFARHSWRAALGLSVVALVMFCMPLLFGYWRLYSTNSIKSVFLVALIAFWILASRFLRKDEQVTTDTRARTITDVLFRFKGRISRSEFWLKGFLPILLVIALPGYSLVFIHDEAGMARVIAYLLPFASLWPFLALYSKRLHDRNRSAWFLLTLLVPIANIGFAFWLIVETWFLRGTVGLNRFGDDDLMS